MSHMIKCKRWLTLVQFLPCSMSREWATCWDMWLALFSASLHSFPEKLTVWRWRKSWSCSINISPQIPGIRTDIPLATGPLAHLVFQVFLYGASVEFTLLMWKWRPGALNYPKNPSPSVTCKITMVTFWPHLMKFSPLWHLTLLLSDALVSLSKHQGENPQTQQTNKHS